MFKDWKKFEIAWLIISTLIILILSIIWKDTFIGTIASITGVLCVVLVAKGKISSYAFGTINAITYGYVAYSYGLYGESDLNWFIYLPTQLLGAALWIQNAKKKKELGIESVNGESVQAKNLTKVQWIYVLIGIAATYIIYSEFLHFRGSNLAGLDGFAVVLSIVAQILMMLRYAEQWIMWIIVNLITIALWVTILIQSGGNDWTVLAMWIAFLINSVYGYINWRKISEVK